MMPIRTLAVVAVLICAGCATTPRTPESVSRELDRLRELGRRLYVVDNMAARGSDAFMAAVNGTPDGRIRGYIVVPEERQMLFLGEVDGEVRRFAVIQLGEQEPTVRITDEAAAELERAMYFARVKAVAAFTPLCDRPHNPIVLRDPSSEDWLVYVLASTSDANEVILAGHSRVRVSGANGAVKEVTPLSKSCLIARRDQAPGDAKTVAFAINNPLSPLPSELHFFTAFLYDVSLGVLGNGGDAYLINMDSVEQVER